MKNQETLAKLEKFRPIRIILKDGPDGKLLGITEESFSMGTSRERVCIFWSGKAYSMLGGAQD